MPYKNPEKQREYQRKWCRRKNTGLPTKTKIPKSEEHKRKVKLVCNARYRERKRKIITDAFGELCFFCRYSGMILHRKDGKKHKMPSELGIREIHEIIVKNKDDYVYLCMTCHKAVHWIMKYLGYTWDKIIQKLKKQLG